jgi:choline dehydrogenase-like flavoprotein
MRVAVIGSGLAGVAAAAALAERGVRPVLLDVGERIDPERAAAVRRLGAAPPEDWDDADRELVFANPTLRDGSRRPKKLAFGSDFFYAAPAPPSALRAEGAAPPFTRAEGGFSQGWGASVLPPADEDLEAWPLRTADLLPFYRRVLEDKPYSARDDGLSARFPIVRSDGAPLQLAPGSEALLRAMERGLFGAPREQVAFGQARVLTRAWAVGVDASGCRYCGECLSGCVYGAIYTANHTLDGLKRSDRIDYQPGVRVDSLREQSGRVDVLATTAGGAPTTLSFDRVFLAAGAVGSTAIILRSRALYDHETRLLSAGGFVAPLVRLSRLRSSWPHANTQPGAFLEFKAEDFSPHWVHTQLSTQSELALELLGIKRLRLGWRGQLKRRLLEHVVVAHCNFHSDHANAYVLTLRRDDGRDVLHTRVEDRADVHVAHRHFFKRLSRLMARCGCFTLPFLARHGKRGESFHIGGSLPMKVRPQRELDTNLHGTPMGFSRVHVVDSSVFPSVPGTTVGLLAMANATRIASEVDLGERAT